MDDDEVKDVCKRGADLSVKAARTLEEAGFAMSDKLLGPSLIILGMSMSKLNSSAEVAFHVTVRAGIQLGIFPSQDKAIEGLREKVKKAGPEGLAAILKMLLPGVQVQTQTLEAPPEDGARERRPFPWRS